MLGSSSTEGFFTVGEVQISINLRFSATSDNQQRPSPSCIIQTLNVRLVEISHRKHVLAPEPHLSYWRPQRVADRTSCFLVRVRKVRRFCSHAGSRATTGASINHVEEYWTLRSTAPDKKDLKGSPSKLCSQHQLHQWYFSEMSHQHLMA